MVQDTNTYTVTLTFLRDGNREESNYTVTDRKSARKYYNYYKGRIGNGIYLSIEFKTF